MNLRRDRRSQRVAVDHGCDRIGGVVETVDEFEAERDDAEQEERQVAGDGRTGRSQILMDAVGRKKKPESHDREENQDRPDPHRVIESWPSNFARCGRDVGGRNSCHTCLSSSPQLRRPVQ